ncbi:transposase domain-containing protein [Nitratireductor soli]|uniref:transposase domain-containing protein n=1 Tax=Nitratireductor soli TaxID=1670619 RepID=UPI00065DD268|nr:transposase domain-containing protein [Nitratireductor soli]
MKVWFTIPELAAAHLPDLPQSKSGMDAYARAQGWKHSGLARQAQRQGGGWEYHVNLLPPAAQARLYVLHDETPPPADHEATKRRNALWERFEGLSKGQKDACEWRLQAVAKAEELRAGGICVDAAATMAARRFGVSRATLFNWLAMVKGYAREDWLAALAPAYKPVSDRAACDVRAFDFLKSDFLRPEKPSFTSCYRRMTKAASLKGWSPIASERALRRRLEAEVPKAVQVLARSGKEMAKTLYPAQRRSRKAMQAMQAVNMDGHKIDVFVRVPWSDKPVRMMLIAIQDLFSGKFLSWRLAEAETWEAVRLTIGDMVELYGIPDEMVFDNGRAFASKKITGGNRTRYRHKIKEEDPEGLLVALGVNVVFTNPYSGQSKPIERAFRDLADTIAKHPFCAGAYTGNRPDAKPENYMSRAVPLDDLREHVAAQIADHNAQAGRQAANCAGRSFDETFAAGMAEAIVRRPTAAQRSLWLLASEAIRAKRGSGEVHFMGNRYWHPALNQHAGMKVTIRFDPDALHQPIKVYTLDNMLICDADCISDTGFRDVDQGRAHNRARRGYEKAVAAQKAAHAKLSAQELADIVYRGAPKAPTTTPIRPRVTRIAAGNLAIDQRQAEPIAEDQSDAYFLKALARMTGDASIIEFPGQSGRGDEPVSSEYGSKKEGGASE